MRIHLSGEDLLHTTIAAAPPPLLEIVSSVRLLRHRGPAPRLPDWRRMARSRLRPTMAPLLDVVPAVGSAVPDFLTPIGTGAGVEAGIDAVLSTPRARVRAELLPMIEAGLVPERVRPLYDGDPGAWRRLAQAFREYHAAFVEPLWPSVIAAVDADRAARGQALATGGMQRVLDTLDPRIRWDTPTLSYTCAYSSATEIAFNGRGIVLQPSLFTHEPTLLVPEDQAPVLTYPVVPRDPAPPPGEPLVALIGRTRAAILSHIADGATTTQLARRAGVSLASASQHAAVLRSAGLIATRRTGPAVLHTLTPLGTTLLAEAHA